MLRKTDASTIIQKKIAVQQVVKDVDRKYTERIRTVPRVENYRKSSS